MRAPENVIADLIRAGLTSRQIREQTRADYARIARIREHHNLPTAHHLRAPLRTIDEALALYTEPCSDGHIRWSGPIRGRSQIFEAGGIRYSARRVVFRRHYHREPLGNICLTCKVPGCLAPEHLADLIARTATDPNDRAAATTQLIELGASDWQISSHLGTPLPLITSIRTQLAVRPTRSQR